MIRTSLIFLICCFFVRISFGQTQSYSITGFGVDQGLDATTIYGIKQDERGFLWMGTDNGLYRFDGVNFKSYGTSDGLTDLEIFNLSLGENVLITHNFSNTSDVIYQDRVVNERLPEIDKKNIRLGLGTYTGSGEFVISERESNYFCLIRYDKGVVTDTTTVWLDPEDRIINVYLIREHVILIYSNDLTINYSVYKGSECKNKGAIEGYSVVSLGVVDGLWCVDLNKTKLFRYILTDSFSLEINDVIEQGFEIKNIAEINPEETWITLAQGGMVQIKGGIYSPIILEDYSINSVFQDKDDNIWVGTYGSGLFKLQNIGISNFGIKELKISKNILSLANGENGSVYIGFDKLVVSEFKKNRIIETWMLKPSSKRTNRRVLDIEKLGNKIWCATDEGLFQIDYFKDTPPKPVHSYCSKTIFYDGDSIYVGSCMDVRVYTRNDLEPEVMWEDRIISICVDDKDNLLLGTIHGLYIRKKNTDIIEKVDQLGNHKVLDIKTGNGKIYAATDSGLCILELGRAVKYLTVNNGLTTNNCTRICLDSRNIWVATVAGLNQITYNEFFRTYSITKITTHVGLLSNHINDLLLRNDTIWVATDQGLSIFRVQDIDNHRNLTTNITGLSSDGQQYSLYNPIELPAQSDAVQISFAGLEFGQNLDYEYRLSPESTEWNHTQNNTIDYHQLGPGDYLFTVNAIDEMGNKSAPTTLSFRINPSFYETVWFKVVLFFLFSGVIVAVFIWNSREIKRKAFENNAFARIVSSLELEAIKAQINPHFIYNCLNSIQFTIISKKNLDAEKQLGMFANLIRDTLDFSRLDFITVEREVEYLERYLYMQKLRFKDQLSYEIIVAGENQKMDVLIPSMLLQPLVENAVKHGMEISEGKTSQIKLSFTITSGRVICKIEDFGKGFSRLTTKENNVPSGTIMTNKRIETYNKLYSTDISISVINKETTGNNAKGTLVCIDMPIRQ
ncbi:MAG: hypothetical protein COA58_07105 [Bacteroidetes bacterium]|nr:MAG: hypothetical protein COA58_07105 [Bacteroidota bacterium]